MVSPDMEIKNFTKKFGKRVAVDNLSFSLPKGSIAGFVGPNGAGKTTTIRALAGHLHPTEGEVRILGTDPWDLTVEQKRQVAYVSESMNIPGWMTPARAIRFNQSFYPAWDHELAERLLQEFDLAEAADFANLSTGQKRRTAILLALCQNADLFIMDEPASGLDVSARHGFLEHILNLACEGNRTVLISSHLLSDLERIIDRVVFLHRGRLTLEGSLDDLKARVRELHLPVQISKADVERFFYTIRHETKGDETIAVVSNYSEQAFQALCQEFQCAEGAGQSGFNLEDLFVQMDQSLK
ncbi:ATP-binding cassette domain-containing protein [bacterium]|nr:ATP-binding cassette domain-containing protein [bacterium]